MKRTPAFKVGRPFNREPRRNLHTAGKIGRRGAVEGQAPDKCGIGKQEIAGGPFAKYVMTERNAVVMQITQSRLR